MFSKNNANFASKFVQSKLKTEINMKKTGFIALLLGLMGVLPMLAQIRGTNINDGGS